MKMVTVTSK